LVKEGKKNKARLAPKCPGCFPTPQKRRKKDNKGRGGGQYSDLTIVLTNEKKEQKESMGELSHDKDEFVTPKGKEKTQKKGGPRISWTARGKEKGSKPHTDELLKKKKPTKKREPWGEKSCHA